MLQNGANIEAQTNFDRTPLHLAAVCALGCAKTLEILIQSDAKLDAKDDEGQTSLHLAVLRRKALKIEMLLRYGASLKIRDNYGLTPLENALQANQANVVLMEKKLKCMKALCYRGIMM